MVRSVRGLVRMCAGLGILLLVGGFAGALHPAGDSLAVFRPHLALAVVGLGALLLVLRDRGWGLYFVLLAAVSGVAPARAVLSVGPDAAEAALSYSFYQRNLLYLARDPGAILAEIEALSPDFVTLQEVSSANNAGLLARLPEGYAHALCPFAGVGAVALATRHRLVAGSVLCIERLGMVAAQVDTPDGRVWLVSVHLHWPWPYRQDAQVAQILPLLSRMQGPILIGGDFNMVRWSDVMSRFERVARAAPVPQGRPTYRLHLIGRAGAGLEIDHVLLPRGTEAAMQRLEPLGSDHRGLLARFAM